MAARQFVISGIVRLSLAAAAAWSVCAPASAQDGAINVLLDRALVVHVDRAADTVIIGNPMIADATVRDNQTLIVTGRSFGTTNLIILDKDGKTVVDSLITVSAADDNLVTVYSRPGRQTYSCTPVCAPTIAIGDDASTFGGRKDQISGRDELSGGGDGQ
jgi:Flp pilus assembly secretin CpaC